MDIFANLAAFYYLLLKEISPDRNLQVCSYTVNPGGCSKVSDRDGLHSQSEESEWPNRRRKIDVGQAFCGLYTLKSWYMMYWR